MRLFKRCLPKEKKELFKTVLNEIQKDSRFRECSQYMMHGKTSVRQHCIKVAYTALFISYKFYVKVDERQLIRGALLHDYFLYDWHEKSLKNSIHGFTHGSTALKEAKKDFNLSATERDMIKHHMFPLTPTAPRSCEGFILCIADKVCAVSETIHRK